MTFRVLASGSTGNAYVVEHDGHRLLLEAGIRFPDLRRALRFQLSTIDACLITHEHQDHAKSVRELLKAGVDCHMSPGTAQALGVTGHRVRFISPGKTVYLPDDWRVLAFEAIHDAAEPLNFLIAHGDEKLLYVTDTSYCPYRFQGLTLVAVEANYSLDLLRENVANGSFPLAHKARVLSNHMSIDRALALLRANDLSRVREVILLHLSAGNSDEERFVSAVRRATGLPVRVAEERAIA